MCFTLADETNTKMNQFETLFRHQFALRFVHSQ